MKIIKTYPGFLLKAITLSFDDGTYHDVEMVNMLNKFNLKGTFNLNSKLIGDNSMFSMDNWLKNYRLNEISAKEIFKNHEIASHTSTHTDFKNVDLDFEIKEDILTLQRMFSYKIVGHAYPYGICNDEIINKLKECGVIYARLATYSHSFELPEDYYRISMTCEMSDSELENIAATYKSLNPDHMTLFTIWGHSYEFDMYHMHERFYNFLESIGNLDDVYYDTNANIYAYVQSFDLLSFENNLLINDSDYDLYLIIDDRKIVIKAHSHLDLL